MVPFGCTGPASHLSEPESTDVAMTWADDLWLVDVGEPRPEPLNIRVGNHPC